MAKKVKHHSKKVIIFIIGLAVILVGVALLVLPGPGLLVIAAGFAILATEFTWAQRLLEKVKKKASQITKKLFSGRSTNT